MTLIYWIYAKHTTRMILSLDSHFFLKKKRNMAVFKPLLDVECGATNSLVKLSQFYTYDNTHVIQVRPCLH